MKWSTVIGMWAVCWIGNLIGSWIMVILFQFSGVLNNEAIAAFFASTAAAKVALSPLNMLFKGILCNICVCLAVWCATKMKSESGKLIMISWCILVFMLCGFEHAIANMSIIGTALFNPAAAAQGVTVGAYFFNLAWATVGNILGGLVFVALPYLVMTVRKD